jgi:NAD(P)-dependent dehydrogenase (short-subunit alcohol dehydrogenase family)
MRVFITGAASGIGRAAALAMADRGLRLFFIDVDTSGLAETRRLAEARGATVDTRQLDVTDIDAVAALADEWTVSHGPMDVVMNIAGVAVFGLIEDMRHADWRRVLDVNLWGTIHVIEHFVPPMIRARRGHLVNIASLAGLVGLPWHAAVQHQQVGGGRTVGSAALRPPSARHRRHGGLPRRGRHADQTLDADSRRSTR